MDYCQYIELDGWGYNLNSKPTSSHSLAAFPVGYIQQFQVWSRSEDICAFHFEKAYSILDSIHYPWNSENQICIEQMWITKIIATKDLFLG